jgi:putative phosphonate metabolism protein
MTDSAPRYAIYFAPKANSALDMFGRGVLGRSIDPEMIANVFPQLTAQFPNWHQRVSAAAHYGFHATLKPPFALSAGVEATWMREDVTALAKTLPRVSIGHLRIARMGRFIALVPVASPAQLGTLAAHIVRSLDPLRAPLTEDDRARRKPDTLTPRQLGYLDQWGYPYVFDEFRFHMTLTGPLPDDERSEAARILHTLYEPYDQPVDIRDICIFAQPNRVAPFTLVERIRLAG